MLKNQQIQALRGLAASLVVLDHALGPVVKSGFLPPYFDAVRFNIGAIGVHIFFVISGFIMVHTTRDQFGKTSSAFGFATKRLIRIVPIYWIATLAAFALSGFGRNSASIPELLQSLAFIPYASSNDVMQPMLGPGWTLNYEMFFYAAFALALLARRQTGLCALIAAFVAITAIGAYFDPAPGPLMFWSQPIILMFVVGVIISILEKSLPRLPNSFLIAAGIIGAEIAICIAFQIHQDPPFPGAVLFAIPSIAAVLVCILSTRSEPTIASWAAQKFGDASYSTYLFHLFVLAALNRVIHPTSIALAVLYVIAALIASNLLGLLLYFVIEQPSGLRLRGILARRRQYVVSHGRIQ